ncbi:inner membrane-spanning protein YciB [Aquicoccus porphyridii]|uniref:Inner membrane-spanning protein YciB n=1 Tax=Aquicoccus porphyridii TaxID=1852029 RepID=A0A5A9Z4I4_9RHOB|nr:inner membrane-spanning protein YciB [Aquicoccus porphyridii]KAA0912106.1 septation protein IspZ [Aquicoccus porphyridii]RAI53039.1 septation protein A [Rhodobacteraceae bacterium AsT-22]
MSEPTKPTREINPMLKMALELGPVLAFFVAYVWLKDRVFTIAGTEYSGFILVTAGFVPLMILSTAILWKLSGHLSRMQVFTVVLVVIFGGLTVWLNDPRFIKMKPTILYLVFGGILGFGLLRGKSLLRVVMDAMVPLTHDGWIILTRRLMLFFFGLAIANELVWRLMSEAAWVSFKTFGLTAAIFVFFMTQGRLFRDHGTGEGDEDSQA